MHNLNFTNDHKKEKRHTCKHVLLPAHVKMAADSLSVESCKRSCWRSFRLQTLASLESGEANHSGQLFNNSTSTG